ncbi:MAG TPA: septum site-determining protein MinC [Candidatus Choladousia intestinipullorum]|nr:septum site-determining protein MinC [Candidatus Choladousia intestinipullorum]
MGRSAVIIKSNPYGLILNLDPELPFDELREAVADKFKKSAGFFKNATLALTFRGRVLTKEQELQLLEAVVQNSGIHVICIVDENKETAEYYKKAVTHAMEKQKEEDGQFYRGTLRSGQTLETESSIVIIGDVNPGAQVISKGNIVVLGCCMGNIYAGASGNSGCFAAALTMKPMQVRIADKLARSAIVKKTDSGEYPIDPKIIFIKDGHLQIKPISGDTLSEYLG